MEEWKNRRREKKKEKKKPERGPSHPCRSGIATQTFDSVRARAIETCSQEVTVSVIRICSTLPWGYLLSGSYRCNIVDNEASSSSHRHIIPSICRLVASSRADIDAKLERAKSSVC